MELVLPAEQFATSFADAQRELSGEGNGRTVALDSVSELLATYARQRAGEDLRPGFVPETTFWLVDGSQYLGRISIRHHLTDALRRYGGHIGYDVRPSCRRQGHATRMLALALPEAHALGIHRALITCAETNVASRRVIERNGGVLDEKFDHDGVSRLRFWISTSPDFRPVV